MRRTSGCHGSLGTPDPGLDLSGVDHTVQALIVQGLSDQTRASYRTGVNRYLRFCRQFSLPPLPLSQLNLCRIVAALQMQNLSPPTIRVYLSGVRYYQIQAGGQDPSRSDMPKLNYVLRATQRVRPIRSRQLRLPITPPILRHLHSIWAVSPVTYTSRMLWAACCSSRSYAQGNSLVRQQGRTHHPCCRRRTCQWTAMTTRRQ